MAKTRQIDPRDYIEPGTGFHKTVGYVVFFASMTFAAVGMIAAIIATSGIALIFILPSILVPLLLYYFRMKTAIAQLRGMSLKIGPKQFPEIHDMVEELADALDIDPPDTYLLESHEQNAFAAKIGAKQFVVLLDDLVWGAQMVNAPDLLRFIIGHELAHHALGHTGLIRSIVRLGYKPLARLDELSCDAVGAALVGEDAARDALAMLLVGPQLFPKMNRPAMERQALEVEDDRYTKRAERQMYHPLLLRRIARMIPDEDGYEDERPSKAKSKAKSNRYDDEDDDR
jgi:Zn-dependent protease with chaperone function